MVRGRQPSRGRSRIGSAILLALAPFLLVGVLETHLGHGSGRAEATIFADAVHAGQAEHFDHVHVVRSVRCNDCLAPAQPLPAPRHAASSPTRLESGAVAVRRAAGPLDPAADRSRRPRAPPSSVLS